MDLGAEHSVVMLVVGDATTTSLDGIILPPATDPELISLSLTAQVLADHRALSSPHLLLRRQGIPWSCAERRKGPVRTLLEGAISSQDQPLPVFLHKLGTVS